MSAALRSTEATTVMEGWEGSLEGEIGAAEVRVWEVKLVGIDSGGENRNWVGGFECSGVRGECREEEEEEEKKDRARHYFVDREDEVRVHMGDGGEIFW
ncbi:hypothetical protein IEQ34_005990 [Dendrobium chrysotoxum]|uniref:Uncharacterized protein n=1 Tax=Dendrobium chrysotoxum TaxID=161865 RepID=A0AAV7HDC0_DENCH|nr:hypothetical protein IEQ34_005990 [Dendrobium chrysotoxum]